MRTAVTNNNALIRYKSDGTEFTDAEYSSSESSFNSLVRRTSNYAITKRDRGDADSSLDSLMQVVDPTSYASENIQWHIGTNTEFDYGAPATQLSGYYYQSDSAFSGNDVVMPDGYDKMIQGLLTNPTSINVQYNTVVTSIDYSQDVINVTTSSGTVYRASKVICTVPLGVLKAGDVKFTPPLPANKQASIDRLRMGSTNKVFAIFPSVFWDNTQTYFGIHTGTTAATRGRFSYWLNAKPLTPNGENLLIGFALGQSGNDFESLTDAQIQSEVLSVLGRMFKQSIPTPTRFLVTRWVSDPYSKGAYSFMTVGATNADFDTLAAKVGENLFFAGEHTSSKYRGTVHGAYLSGQNAALQVRNLPVPASAASISSMVGSLLAIVSCLFLLL
jgi:monoamine oxidase